MYCLWNDGTVGKCKSFDLDNIFNLNQIYSVEVYYHYILIDMNVCLYRLYETEELHNPQMIFCVGLIGLVINLIGLCLFHGKLIHMHVLV